MRAEIAIAVGFLLFLSLLQDPLMLIQNELTRNSNSSSRWIPPAEIRPTQESPLTAHSSATFIQDDQERLTHLETYPPEYRSPTFSEIGDQQALELKSRFQPINGDSIMVRPDGFSNHRFRRRR